MTARVDLNVFVEHLRCPYRQPDFFRDLTAVQRDAVVEYAKGALDDAEERE